MKTLSCRHLGRVAFDYLGRTLHAAGVFVLTASLRSCLKVRSTFSGFSLGGFSRVGFADFLSMSLFDEGFNINGIVPFAVNFDAIFSWACICKGPPNQTIINVSFADIELCPYRFVENFKFDDSR